MAGSHDRHAVAHVDTHGHDHAPGLVTLWFFSANHKDSGANHKDSGQIVTNFNVHAPRDDVADADWGKGVTPWSGPRHAHPCFTFNLEQPRTA